MKKLENEPFAAKYCSNAISLKRSGSSIERISNTLYSSKITMTPHQIDAALFAFKSPTRKGVILADEVGLGKTIEAGIIIAQTWFEKRGKVIIVAPASLMKQWQSELSEKFNLESVILDRKYYNSYAKRGYINPINLIESNIIIVSYQMCSALKDEIRNCRFDLAIIDEAHKLRNVYNEKSITSNNVKYALQSFKKVLLTATPIQNNLLDLYGICSVIDEDIFGDINVFKYNYIKNYDENIEELEHRLKSVMHRTLRSQVQQYIKFTNRIPKTFYFEQNDIETAVYESIRKLLLDSGENSYLIPKSQKHLIVLILCKLMGSSMRAIIYTLKNMRNRLIETKQTGIIEEINLEDYEIDDEEYVESSIIETSAKIDQNQINREIETLTSIIELAESVNEESKYSALLQSLKYSFAHLKKIGAEEKVLIFTESKRTQEFLSERLKRDGYEKVILYNGSNNDANSKEIYNEWIMNHPASSVISKNINMKSAIIDKFRKDGQILIATEAGAEGLNLQFCSLVINYDLPWNPQRVEQRIGRCHRFGQKHDVVVINFINSTNVVEQRIYELLNSKFRLFNEILGSSDTVLGGLEDGKDLERSIVDIYSTCRTNEEINNAFDALQDKYKDNITESIQRTKEELMSNFEEDVQQYFTDILTSAQLCIDETERLLWRLLQSVYGPLIPYDDENFVFEIDGKKYRLSSKNCDNFYESFSLNSKLGERIVEIANSYKYQYGHVVFNISDYKYRLSRIDKLLGKHGYMVLHKVSIDSFEKEEHLVFNAILDDGTRIDQEVCEMLFRLKTTEYITSPFTDSTVRPLLEDSKINIKNVINQSEEKNNKFLSEEIERINLWADDKIQSVQLEVEQMRIQRKELQQQSDLVSNSIEKENIENQIIKLSKKIKLSWLELADAEEEVENQRKQMISNIRKVNSRESRVEMIFLVSFEIA